MRLEDVKPTVWEQVLEVMEASLKDVEFEAEDIEFDWRIGANARKLDRELYERYGLFKDIILSRRFQYIKSLVQENVVLNFNFLLGDPLMPLLTCIIVLSLMRTRLSYDVIGLFAAFVFNVNPLYVVLGYIMYKFKPQSSRLPKQYRPPSKASSEIDKKTSWDHVLIGADISTLYTAALLSRVGHRCCVLKPLGALPLEMNASDAGSSSSSSSISSGGAGSGKKNNRADSPSRAAQASKDSLPLADLPPIPLVNLVVGKADRYQALLDMVASDPEDKRARVCLVPVGTSETGFVHSVLKMRKGSGGAARALPKRKDLVALRPGEHPYSLTSDAAKKLLADKPRLEAFLGAVQRDSDSSVVQFLNSRCGESQAQVLEMARGESAQRVYNLATETCGDLFERYQPQQPQPPPNSDSTGGTGTGLAEAEAEAEVENAAQSSAEEEQARESEAGVAVLLERVSQVGSEELFLTTQAPSFGFGFGFGAGRGGEEGGGSSGSESVCSGFGLSQALTVSSQGAFYPRGGPAALMRYFEGIIVRAGGCVRSDVDIQGIDIDCGGNGGGQGEADVVTGAKEGAKAGAQSEAGADKDKDKAATSARARGVVLGDGSTVKAEQSVISGAGMLTTYLGYLAPETLQRLSAEAAAAQASAGAGVGAGTEAQDGARAIAPSQPQPHSQSPSPSPSPLSGLEDLVEAAPRCLALFWLSGSASECGLSGASADYWDFGGCKVPGTAQARVWCPSAKDPSWAQRYPQVQAVVVELTDPQFSLQRHPLLPRGPAVFSANNSHTRTTNAKSPRSPAASASASASTNPAAAAAAAASSALMDAAKKILQEVYPLARARIAHQQLVSTGSSTGAWAGAHGRGSSFAFTKSKFAAPISSRSLLLPGLYFCGKDMATSGFAADVQGGYVAACSVLGYSRAELLAGVNVAADVQGL